MHKHKFLVVGAGSIGSRHARNLMAMGIDVSVYDAYKEPVGFNTVSDIDGAIKSGNFNAGIICTPADTHVHYAHECVNAGMNIFIEKPLTSDAMATLAHRREIEEMSNKLRDQKLTCMLGYMLRFEPGMAHLLSNKENIPTPSFVQIECGSYMPLWRPGVDYRKMYTADRKAGGGVVHDSSHEIDYALALFGVPTDVKASYGKFSNFDINTEDVAEIQLLYERGSWESSFIVTLHLDYLQREIVRRMKIYSVKKPSDHTCIEWTYGQGVLVKQYFDPDNPAFNEMVGPLWQKPYSFDPNNMYIREMKHFIKCCENKLQGEQVWPGASLTDGIEVMNIIARVMGNARCRK